MSNAKVYAIDVSVKVDGKERTLTVFTRAESKTKAIKQVVRARRATAEDFMPVEEQTPAESPQETSRE